jgi:Do/DeqQ family serine protease
MKRLRALFVFAAVWAVAGLLAAPVSAESPAQGPGAPRDNVLLAQALPSPERVVPPSRQAAQASFAPLVRTAAPAVVNVYGARREARGRNPFMDDPFFREFFGGGGGGMPRDRVQQSVGSGVIVAEEGIVVTNHHVVEGMTEVRVSLADRREFDAELILRDPRTDLAVLRIKGANGRFPSVRIADSDRLEVGDLVLAIGNPFGVGQTVTSGIVSALARTQVGISDYQFFIQTDAAINPGNSGGALIDMTGALVGINTAIFSRSGGSHGIGFAIPANMVRIVVDSARGGAGSVRRPWFGARLEPIDREKAEGLGLDRPSGALVVTVADKSPAAEAGLRRGDVIVAIDGQEVTDPDGFGYRFATKGVQGETSLAVMRSGRRLVLPVRLIAAPETRPRDIVRIRGRTPLTGASVGNLSPALAEELSIDAGTDGAVVVDIEANSPAQQLGFQKGDILLQINGERPATSRDVERLLRERTVGWQMRINRSGQVLGLEL